jgi:hypothetical protein
MSETKAGKHRPTSSRPEQVRVTDLLRREAATTGRRAAKRDA